MGDTRDGTWTSTQLGGHIQRELYRWERREQLLNVWQLDHDSQMQRTLAAYFLFIYKEKYANGVTQQNKEVHGKLKS